MTSLSELPWPQCLGQFDEESCLLFLAEVGKRIVPFYPFQLGMEQVHGIILDRYGYDGSTDCLSVLQELLEDDNLATGLGDDGDIWRSWRHGWRHRNDDTHNPFISRVGCLILQPPTIPSIRLLKAANFEQLQSQTVFEKEKTNCSGKAVEASLGDSRILLNDQIDVHLDTLSNPIFINDSRRSGSTSCSRIDYLRRRNAQTSPCTDIRSKLTSIPYDCHRGSRIAYFPFRRNGQKVFKKRSDHKNIVDLRGGEVAAESPRISLPLTAGYEVACTEFNGADDVTQHISKANPAFTAIEKGTIACNAPSGSEVQGDAGAVNIQPDSPSTQQRLARQPYRARLVSREKRDFPITNPFPDSDHLTSVCIEDTRPNLDHLQRLHNRRARLIDGTLLHSVSQKHKSVIQPGTVTLPANTTAIVPKHRKLSSSPVLQTKSSHQVKWFSSLWFSHGSKSVDEKLQGRRRHYSFPLCSSSVSTITQSDMHVTDEEIVVFPPATSHSLNSYQFGINGSTDAPEGEMEINSFFNANKPLPPEPKDSRPSVSSENQRAFFNSDSDLCHRSQTSSKCYSRGSRLSNVPSTYVRSPIINSIDQSPKISVKIGSEEKGHKLNPTEVDYSQRSPKSFTSVANQNPFLEDGSPRIKFKPPPPSLMQHQISSDEWPFRSRQLENLQMEADAKMSEATMENTISPSDRQEASEQNETDRDHSRGWTNETTPVKDTKSGSEPGCSQKRSPSPIRKLFNIGKNSPDTTKAPEGTPAREPVKNVASHGRKWSLKEWKNKIRHGFLTADEEQLQHEDLMEQQYQNENIRIVAPTLPSRSLFPVSLRPPDQSKVIADIELFISIAANSFLKREARAARISSKSVAEVKSLWEAKNKPQAIEFLFDIGTQRSLVVANLQTVDFCGDAANDPIALCSTLQAWKILVREISPRTLCNPDSVIRRWMHDTRRILEILGCGNGVMFACDTLSLATYKAISDKERQRVQDQDTGFSTNPTASQNRGMSDGVLDIQSYRAVGKVNPNPIPKSKPCTIDTVSGGGNAIPIRHSPNARAFDKYLEEDQTTKSVSCVSDLNSAPSLSNENSFTSAQEALVAAGHHPRFVVE